VHRSEFSPIWVPEGGITIEDIYNRPEDVHERKRTNFFTGEIND